MGPAGNFKNLTCRLLGSYGVFAIACILAMAFLLLDLALPLVGIAGGVPYVAVVLLGLWFPTRRQVSGIIVICILLVVAGDFLSTEDGLAWKARINRGLAIFAIISTGVVIHLIKETQGTHAPVDTDDPGGNSYEQVNVTGYRGLAAGLPILLMVIAVAIWIGEKSEQSRKWVSRTHQIQLTLDSILSELQDAETGQRGFLLTGNDAYLEPFTDARSRLADTLEKLKRLTADNPGQRQYLARIRPLITAKLNELNKGILLLRTEGPAAALAVVSTNQGKVIMGQLRFIIGKMKTEEKSLLVQRERDHENDEMLARAANIIGFILIALIGTLVVFRIKSLLAVRNKIDLELQAAKTATEKANLDLQTLTDELEQRAQRRTRELAETLELQRRLGQTVEQSPVLIFITDTDGAIEYANAKFYAVTGYTPDEIIGQNPRIIQSGDTPRVVYDKLWQTLRAGGVWRGELKGRRKDGSFFWVNATLAPIYAIDGSVSHYFASHEDITLRKTAELEMRQARNQAEIANRAKSDLMANMSHELRTPLNAIIGFSSTIKEELFGPLNNDKYLEYLNDIHYSGQHLLELINDILDVSAIEAGALELHEEDVNLHQAIKASVRLVKPRAETGGVSVVSSVDPAMPLLYGDERRIKQIFLNLLSNAVKFTPPGGDVVVSSWMDGDGSLVVAVSDTGIGMDEDELEIALSQFGQIDSGLNRKHEGTGLGLTLTKGLIEQQDGTLVIKSEKGHGTQAEVTFAAKRIVANTD